MLTHEQQLVFESVVCDIFSSTRIRCNARIFCIVVFTSFHVGFLTIAAPDAYRLPGAIPSCLQRIRYSRTSSIIYNCLLTKTAPRWYSRRSRKSSTGYWCTNNNSLRSSYPEVSSHRSRAFATPKYSSSSCFFSFQK